MKEYNDYISITRRWLKEYNTFKATVANMDADIKAQEELLTKAQDLGAPIANYDAMPRGGSAELNAVESAAQDRIRRQQAIYRERLNRDEIQRIIDRIDRAMLTLEEEDQDVLREYYLDKNSWVHIGQKYHYSERWAREKGGKALRTVAFVIFGVKARPEQLAFVFAE